MNYRRLILLLLVTFYPVWIWYVKRMTDGSDEPWGLLALLSSLAFVPWKRLGNRVPEKLLWYTGSMLLLYGIGWGYLMPILRAFFAMLILGTVLVGARAPAGVLGLLTLSLPWIATVQFYAGYPLRVLTGEVARWLLLAVGLDVQREGVTLIYNGLQVMIDRPCAGVYMLWFGAFFTYLLASIYKLGLGRCYQLAGVSFVVIVLVNIVRNTLLFFVESGLWQLPGFAHELIGAFLFLLAVVVLLKFINSRAEEIVYEA